MLIKDFSLLGHNGVSTGIGMHRPRDLLQNIGRYFPRDTASYSKALQSSACALPLICEYEAIFRHLHLIPLAERVKAWVFGIRLLGSWVWIPPGTWMSVFFECFVLSGRGLCVGLITRPEESYRILRVYCDREASTMWRPWPTRDCRAMEKNPPSSIGTYTV
jgi:hypothetical protein